MKNRKSRKGFGLGQIMATLLVVLPTLAFLITFMIDYWSVMQNDNRLKLIANLASTEFDGLEDLSTKGLSEYTSTQDWSILKSKLDQLCPSGNIVLKPREDAQKGIVNIVVSYDHNGRYFKKTISTNMSTYSYHDQNATIKLVCQ